MHILLCHPRLRGGKSVLKSRGNLQLQVKLELGKLWSKKRWDGCLLVSNDIKVLASWQGLERNYFGMLSEWEHHIAAPAIWILPVMVVIKIAGCCCLDTALYIGDIKPVMVLGQLEQYDSFFYNILAAGLQIYASSLWDLRYVTVYFWSSCDWVIKVVNLGGSDWSTVHIYSSF